METPAARSAEFPLSSAEYVRSRHAVWMSSAALITDELGRILIVRDRASGRWLLPGGGVEAGESPWSGCRREVREETGLELAPNPAELLVMCWIAVEDRERYRGLGFPGDVMTVFDGGTLTEQQATGLCCVDGEIAEYAFCDSTRAAAVLTPLSARVALAALRARLGNTGPAYLESGSHLGTPPPLDRHGVHVRPRSGRSWSWHREEPVPEGLRVITADIDPYVIHRTRRLCAEAGSDRVTAVLRDGSLGAPEVHVPEGGFDGMLITHNTWDIAPAWRQQLVEERYLVLPLEIHGYVRAIAFQRQGDVLHARHWTYCGFVRDRGAAARTSPAVTLADGRVQLHFHDGPGLETTGVEEALRGERHEAPTAVVLPGECPFDTLQVYAATTLPGHCRLTTERSAEHPLVAARAAYLPALVADGSLAYLTTVQLHQGETPAESRHEFYAHAYGPSGPALAERLTSCVQEWDRHVRHTGYPPMTAHPAGTPDHDLPAGYVLDKTAARLVFPWPAGASSTRPEALAVGSAGE